LDCRKLILVSVTSIFASLVSICVLSGCRSGIGSDNVSGRTIYVSSGSDCGDEAPCHATIQEAVDAASRGDVIKVAGGVYTSTAMQVVSIEKSLCLIGGYHAEDWSLSRPDVYPTIIDAEGVPGRSGVRIDGSGVATVTVEGFRITRGVAHEPGGGGIRIVGGAVVLVDTVIESCRADDLGGGMLVANGRVNVRDCTFRSNVAEYGGGLYVRDGSVTLQRTTFTLNQAPPMGGAIAIEGGALTGMNNLVADNTGAGAGVYLSGGNLKASHWTLVNNGRYGIIVDLGIDIDSGSATVDNTIVVSHQGGFCGSGASAHQTLFHDVVEPCIAGASCVNNLFGDPRFLDRAGGDYHVSSDSPAVDQAYSVDVACDMDGDVRPVGTASDIGADEIAPHTICLPLIIRDARSP